MENLFEQMPKAVFELHEKIDKLTMLVLSEKEQKQEVREKLLTVKEAAEYLSLSVPTIYGLISKGELPVMKRSKRCYFTTEGLLNYLKMGRRKSKTDLDNVVDSYLKNNKRK